MGWKGLALLGAIMILGGVLAFLNPFAASLAAEAIAGAAFLTAGAMQLWFAVSDGTRAPGDRWLSGGLGAVLMLFAVSLVLNPLAGLVTLTALVALFFTVIGAFRIALAWHMRPAHGLGLADGRGRHLAAAGGAHRAQPAGRRARAAGAVSRRGSDLWRGRHARPRLAEEDDRLTALAPRMDSAPRL